MSYGFVWILVTMMVVMMVVMCDGCAPEHHRAGGREVKEQAW